MWTCSAARDLAGLRDQPISVQHVETFAFSGTPSWRGPEFPKSLTRGPNGDQWSNQKLAILPSPTSHRKNCWAMDLSFSKDFQVHEDCLDSSMDQNEASVIRWVLIHDAQRDSFSEKRSQISFRHRVLFHVVRSRSPNPPSSLGIQTHDQETFAAARVVMFPFLRNLEHRNSIDLTQPFGRREVLRLYYYL